MTRDEALKLVNQKMNNKNLVKHVLAVEAVMRALAVHFGEDADKWGLAGLLHDIDYEETKNDMQKHSKVGSEMLRKMGLSEEICQAVLKHNDAHGLPRETKVEKALYVSDPITGLIVAATLVLPSKKITHLSTENVLNRFNEKSFAKGANREVIAKCDLLLGMSLREFSEVALNAMHSIAADLELN